MPLLLYSKSLFKFHANYQLKLQEMFNLSKAMPQASLLWNIGITINEVITKQKCNWQTGGGGLLQMDFSSYLTSQAIVTMSTVPPAYDQ